MAYSKLSSRFSFILLNPQRDVTTVDPNDRNAKVVTTGRSTGTAWNDRTATVAATSRRTTVTAQSRTAVAQPE